jgi:hypothetical protein
LELRLPGDLVVAAPWSPDLRPHFSLKVSVDDCTIGPKSVRLRARCEFWDRRGRTLLGVKRFDDLLPAWNESPEKNVERLAQLLRRFGDALGEDMERIRNGQLDLLQSPPPGEISPEEAAVPASAPLALLVDESPPPPELPAGPAPRPLPADLALEALAPVYVTIDDAATGGRIFSRRLRPHRRLLLPCDGPVRISASNPPALLVDGKPLAESGLRR